MLCAAGASLLWLLAVSAEAHTTLPAYLELNELDTPGSFELLWRVPAVEGPPAAIVPVVPAYCVPRENPSEVAAAASVFTSGIIDCGHAGLIGQEIRIDGLQVTIMDVLVRITFADHTTVTHLLRANEPAFTIQKAATSRTDVLGYVRLGVAHILGGIDHLLFVLGLLLIVSGAKPLLKAVTAFTVAHSITLALATFGVVRIAPTPIEAVIALSIVFLAVELAHHADGRDGLTYRQPWLVAFAFGLLHGFGFAGTLSQIGIPPRDIPVALLSFNVGVELGQLSFIAAFLAFLASLRSLEVRFPRWTVPLPAYTIGSFASFWFLQRCALIFGF
jgi:hydrogenase/urease accessory protein HupE